MFYIYLFRLVRQGLYHQKKQGSNPQRQGVTAQQRQAGGSTSSLQRQSNSPQRQGQPPQPRQHHPVHPAASQQLRYAFSGKQYQTTGNNPAQRQVYHDPHVYARSASAKNKLKQVNVSFTCGQMAPADAVKIQILKHLAAWQYRLACCQ